MYAELLPDILASRVPKTAEGTPYPVAGEGRLPAFRRRLPFHPARLAPCRGI